jgi:type IV pilus assembly protein PilQ
MELSAQEASGRGNIVSNPRVLATEDTEAVIEQGVELPYQVQYTRSACKSMFRKVNLRLEVIPTVYEDELISLSVEINKDSVASKTEHGYVIDTKHVRTQALVESGGTVILGGVFQDVEKNEAHKVPGLGDIPLLGYLFKEEAKVKDKTELLIFLTPTLVQAPNPR